MAAQDQCHTAPRKDPGFGHHKATAVLCHAYHFKVAEAAKPRPCSPFITAAPCIQREWTPLESRAVRETSDGQTMLLIWKKDLAVAAAGVVHGQHRGCRTQKEYAGLGHVMYLAQA